VCAVYDAEGREYLDLLAGIGVGALGHGHEGLAQAIAEQSREMIHCSNLFFHPLQGQVAERLARLSGLSRAFFCNSGAEAVEACLKFARRYWHTKGSLDRTEIIAMEGDFHGRTMGALSTTWTEQYRKPFEPLLPNVDSSRSTRPHFARP
jgi:acetylornithine aminotransferase/acetylornithine/N-succinyldiaminopimelate aminotransferase